MIKKVKVLLTLITLSVCLCVMSSTYSRYVANAKSDINATFSKWQILVNDSDITNGSISSLPITPFIIEDDNIATGVIAPTSKGYFDIEINPTNIDVSFKYNIDLVVDNDYVPDLLISKYAILPSDYVEGNGYSLETIVDGSISEIKYYDKFIPYEIFTIRVFFEWFDGETKTMSDEDQADVGLQAAKDTEGEVALQIQAEISFEQYISE